MYFLTRRPALLVFSDLAAAGVGDVARRFELGDESERVCFAAIDALELPIADETVDLVYGNAIVHHLPDLDWCLAEAARVLKPGGRTVFMDAAYAPLWQGAKSTWLRPLMRLSHHLYPRSPEDRRYTIEGGFRESELGPKIRALGGEPFFHRHGFLFYLWQRGARRLLPASLAGFGEHPGIARLLTRLDERLARFEVVRRNQVRLVWGFTKAPSAT